MRLPMFALAGLVAACGPNVYRYKVQASLGSGRVDAFQVWPSVGDTLVAGASRFDPPPSVLKTWEQKAGWLTYASERSCFGIVSHQRVNVQFADGQQGSTDTVTDFAHAKYTLATASGQTLASEPPTVHTTPLEMRFASYDAATHSNIPALEHWVRSDVEVCFATPKPLAEEKWVKWSYGGGQGRDEITFTIDGGKPTTTQGQRKVLELAVDAAVTGMLRNKQVRAEHQTGRLVMRGPLPDNQVEATLTLVPHVTCVFRGTFGRDTITIPLQACRDNPGTTVEGNVTETRSSKSMELTMQVKRPDGKLDLVMELTE